MWEQKWKAREFSLLDPSNEQWRMCSNPSWRPNDDPSTGGPGSFPHQTIGLSPLIFKPTQSHLAAAWHPRFPLSSLWFSSSAHHQSASPLLPPPQLGLSSVQALSVFFLAPGLAWDLATLSSDGGSETPSGSGRATKDSVSGGEGKEKLELEKNLRSNCCALLFWEMWKWILKNRKVKIDKTLLWLYGWKSHFRWYVFLVIKVSKYRERKHNRFWWMDWTYLYKDTFVTHQYLGDISKQLVFILL